MSPNGRRRFRKLNRRIRQHGPAEVRERARNTNGGKARKMILVQWWGRDPLPLPAKAFTARSLVGMSQKARKRLRHDLLFGPNVAPTKLLLADSLTVQLHIGERLRPCPGCCACWGHRISSAYGEIAECCGPQTSGKRKSQIKAMRKWQETLADNCDGSGVLPARKEKP